MIMSGYVFMSIGGLYILFQYLNVYSKEEYKMDLSKAMKMMLGFIGVLILLAPLTAFAQNKVVVIPLFGDDAKPLKNIVTVAKANGMFTDPLAAVNSITDASEINPYVVVIGPGIYTISKTLVMKPYVNITGCGENFTILKGAISKNVYNESAIISGIENSALTSLTVENTGALCANESETPTV
jgi:pectin methylesterase-like acyl-CoA thioesterase